MWGDFPFHSQFTELPAALLILTLSVVEILLKLKEFDYGRHANH